MARCFVPRVLVYVLDRALAERHAGDHREGVSVVHGDIFRCAEAECLVTAGNSFGMMDGGIDGLVNYQFDMIEGRVQAEIAAPPWRGELPVGAAILVDAPSALPRHTRDRANFFLQQKSRVRHALVVRTGRVKHAADASRRGRLVEAGVETRLAVAVRAALVGVHVSVRE